MKKTLLLCFYILAVIVLGACSCTDQEHITQEKAEEIANGLIGGGATYVKTEINENLDYTKYIFTDQNGVEFYISSYLARPGIDDATIRFSALECHVDNNYSTAVLKHNEEQILQIFEHYELSDYLANAYFYDNSICLDLYLGTAEENSNILRTISTAATEIDSLLDMVYDSKYGDKIEDEYFWFSDNKPPYICVDFFEKSNDTDTSKQWIDAAVIYFSTSLDTRWTADSFYEALKSELPAVQVTE